jgi:hypothetical protein
MSIPSPEPFVFVVKNGSKILFKRAESIPCPLSENEISIQLPLAVALILLAVEPFIIERKRV